MAKRKQHYEILEHVSGSFIGTTGRVRYEAEAGVIAEGEIDPEVLDVLLATGTAVKAAKSAESEESE